MSAPDHTLERQQRRHRGPLVGMAVVVGLVIAGFVWWLGHEVEGADPGTPATAIETAPPSAIPPETAPLPARPDAPPATAP